MKEILLILKQLVNSRGIGLALYTMMGEMIIKSQHFFHLKIRKEGF